MSFRQHIQSSLLARALLSNFLLIATSVVALAILFLFIQLAGLRRQVNLRAEAIAYFVAAQSEFGMLIGDRYELNRIAYTTLAIEGVLFVVMNDQAGNSIRLSRSEFPSQNMPAGSFSDESFAPLVRTGARARFLEV